jgi:crotonobetainyl-CoA:carnitine CoA-transferase CaiB-like acyl-CoA transferase
MVQLMGPLIAAFVDQGYLQPRLGSGIPYSVPRGTYLSADGRWVAISATAQPVARRVLELLGVEDDPRFQDQRSRIANRRVMDDLMQQWIGARSSAEVLAEFERIDAAAALVYTVEDLVHDDHIRQRGTLVDVDGYTMQGLVARFSRTPGAVQFSGQPLGAETDTFDDWAAAGAHGDVASAGRDEDGDEGGAV